MPKTPTQSLNLSRAYTYEGHTYGPGTVDVPEPAAESIRGKEAEYQQYLAEGGEPHPPVTPSAGGQAVPDPRLRLPGTVPKAGATPGAEATAPHGTQSPAAQQHPATAPAGPAGPQGAAVNSGKGPAAK